MSPAQQLCKVPQTQLLTAIRMTALHLSRLRKAEALYDLPALDYLVPSTPEQMDTDWRGATVLVAGNVVNARPRLSDLEPDCLPLLEDVWMDEIKEHIAYFAWVNSRDKIGFWSGENTRRDHYQDGCTELRQLLTERRSKDRLENFGPIRDYISAKYLDEFHRWNGECSEVLAEAKASRLTAQAHNAISTVVATEYCRKYYENIIPAVETNDPDACTAVLQSFQHCGTWPNFPGIVNALEAAIVISFMDAGTIQMLWKTAPLVSRDTTF